MKRSHPEKNVGETSKKRKTYTCEECTQPFTRKDRLETHIQNNHLPFNCKFCSKGREISLPCENRGSFLEQKFWLSRLLPRTVLLDLDTDTDDTRGEFSWTYTDLYLKYK